MLTFYDWCCIAGLDAPECAGHCDARRPNSVHRLRQKAGGQVQKRGQVLKPRQFKMIMGNVIIFMAFMCIYNLQFIIHFNHLQSIKIVSAF